MKLTFLFTIFGLCFTQLHAQTDASAPPAAPAAPNPMATALTTDERAELIAARSKVFADDPSLQTEESDLRQQATVLHSGTPSDADKQAFMTKVMAHREKMRAAMLKADPGLKPLFAKIDAAVAQMQANGGQPAH